MLNVAKGSVTPFCLLNLSDEGIKNFIFVVDSALNKEYLAIHPMINTHTMWVKRVQLLELLKKHGINHRIFDATAVPEKKEEKSRKE